MLYELRKFAIITTSEININIQDILLELNNLRQWKIMFRLPIHSHDACSRFGAT